MAGDGGGSRLGEIVAGGRAGTTGGTGGVMWTGAGAGDGGGGGVLGRAKRADGFVSGADTTLLMTLCQKKEPEKHCTKMKRSKNSGKIQTEFSIKGKIAS